MVEINYFCVFLKHYLESSPLRSLKKSLLEARLKYFKKKKTQVLFLHRYSKKKKTLSLHRFMFVLMSPNRIKYFPFTDYF